MRTLLVLWKSKKPWNPWLKILKQLNNHKTKRISSSVEMIRKKALKVNQKINKLPNKPKLQIKPKRLQQRKKRLKKKKQEKKKRKIKEQMNRKRTKRNIRKVE